MSSKPVSIEVSDGAAIPRKKDRGLLSAWWLSFIGAIAITAFLCLSRPDPYLRILSFVPDGILVTFQVTTLSILLALVLGLITGLGRISRNRLSSWPRPTWRHPALVQLFYIYYALATIPLVSKLPPMASAVIAMGFCYGAYMGEVFRAGIESIDKGQTEAARSLGFNRRQTMTLVILPQAWRTILPPVGNEFIALLKDSSLVSILAVADLLRRGREFAGETFFYFEAYTIVALVYLIITLVLSKGVSHMESRLNYYDRH
jgi:polar amino acid transport system permease protein